MADIEKVIKGLERCEECLCKDCTEKEASHYRWDCTAHETFVKEALELLKEPGTGHWIYLENCSNSGVYCSECNTKVFDNYPFKKKFSYFCPHCGTRMEGETERR